MVEAVVSSLQERGEVRSDADPRTLATIAFGSYYTAFLRQQDTGDLADRVVAATWPAMAKVD